MLGFWGIGQYICVYVPRSRELGGDPPCGVPPVLELLDDVSFPRGRLASAKSHERSIGLFGFWNVRFCDRSDGGADEVMGVVVVAPVSWWK